MPITLQKQANRHDPENGIWGDCHRTAYAMLLGLPRDEVPHVFDKDASPEEGNAAMAAFLRSRGLAEVALPFTGNSPQDIINVSKLRFPPGFPLILGGTSRLGFEHSVVLCDGETYDPSQVDSGIVGPCKDGFYWLSFVVPLP